MDTIQDWNSLRESYRKFVAGRYHSVCDDGGLAEGYSDRVEFLFVHRWGDLEMSSSLMTDRGFAKFVVKHVDDLMSQESVKAIAKNARTNCPAGLNALCRAVLQAAKNFKPE